MQTIPFSIPWWFYAVIILTMVASVLTKVMDASRRDERTAGRRGRAIRRATPEKESPVEDEAEIPDFRVKAVQYFFSKAEERFFEDLTRVAADRQLKVLSKVKVEDLLRPDEGAPRSHRNYYALQHVDFVLLEGVHYRPVMAIELDGKTHERNEQVRRDEIKKRVFKAARLPLVRFSNGASEKEISQKLDDVLGRSLAQRS